MGIDLGTDYKPEKEADENATPKLQKKATFGGSFGRANTNRENGGHSGNTSPGPPSPGRRKSPEFISAMSMNVVVSQQVYTKDML